MKESRSMRLRSFLCILLPILLFFHCPILDSQSNSYPPTPLLPLSILPALPPNISMSIPYNSFGPYSSSSRFALRFYVVDPTPRAFQGSVSFLPFLYSYNPLGNISLPLVLPATADDQFGCSTSSSGLGHDGNRISGRALLLSKGSCSVSIKTATACRVGAPLLILTGYSAPVYSSTVTNNCSIPILLIQSVDGTSILVQGLLSTGAPFYVSLVGASPFGTNRLDKAAVVDLANNSKWALSHSAASTLGLGMMNSLSNLAANNALDPCLGHFFGIYCENDRVVYIGWASLIWTLNTGVFSTPPSFAGLTALRMFDVTGSGLISLDSNFCDLPSLTTLILDSSSSLSSLPNCLNSLPNLRYFSAVSCNFKSSFPDLGAGISSLLYLDFSNNQLTSLPVNFATFPYLNYLALANNAISISSSVPPTSFASFANYAALSSLKLSNNLINGVLTPTHFDNCSSLQTVDLSRNRLTGVVPNFFGSSNLQYLDLSQQNGGLTGTVNSVTFAKLKSLTTLILAQNQLVSPLTLTSCSSLTYIDISFNNFTSPASSNFLTGAIPATANTFIANNNQLSGSIGTLSSTFPALQTLDLAYNQFKSTPTDVFQSSVLSIDLSFNALIGTIPAGSPVGNFRLFKVNGNPSLQQGSLPSWISQSSTVQTQSNSLYSCPILYAPGSTQMTIGLDPSYYNYFQCSCIAGYYGLIPNCLIIPDDSVELTNFNASIFSNNSSIPTVLNSADIDYIYSTAIQLHSNSFHNALVKDLIASRSITDASFDNQRYTPGMNVRWNINTNNNTTSNNPVLVITILLFINVDVFTSLDNEINIFSGSSDLSGPLIFSIRGDYNSRLNEGIIDYYNYINLYNYTQSTHLNSSSWSAIYFPNTALFSIQVLANQADIQFISKDIQLKHFQAEYYTSVVCPSGYFVDPSINIDTCTPIPLCTQQDYGWSITECNANGLTRTIDYFKSSSTPCLSSVDGSVDLPSSSTISCDYLPSSSKFASLYTALTIIIMVIVVFPLLYALITGIYHELFVADRYKDSTETSRISHSDISKAISSGGEKGQKVENNYLVQSSNSPTKPAANRKSYFARLNIKNFVANLFSLDHEYIHALSNWPIWRLIGNFNLLIYIIGCFLSLAVVFINIGQLTETICETRISLVIIGCVCIHLVLFLANLTAKKQSARLLFSTVQWKSKMLTAIFVTLSINAILLLALFYAIHSHSSEFYTNASMTTSGFAVVQSKICEYGYSSNSLIVEIILIILFGGNGMWIIIGLLFSIYRWLNYWQSDIEQTITSENNNNSHPNFPHKKQTADNSIKSPRLSKAQKQFRLEKVQAKSLMLSYCFSSLSFIIVIIATIQSTSGANNLLIVFIQNSSLLLGISCSFFGLLGPSLSAYLAVKCNKKPAKSNHLKDNSLNNNTSQLVPSKLSSTTISYSDEYDKNNNANNSLAIKKKHNKRIAENMIELWSNGDNSNNYSDLNTLQGVLSDEIASTQLLLHAKASFQEESILFLNAMKVFVNQLAVTSSEKFKGKGARDTEKNNKPNNNNVKNENCIVSILPIKSSDESLVADVNSISKENNNKMSVFTISNLLNIVRTLHDEYIRENSNSQINISSLQRDTIQKSLIKLFLQTIEYCNQVANGNIGNDNEMAKRSKRTNDTTSIRNNIVDNNHNDNGNNHNQSPNFTIPGASNTALQSIFENEGKEDRVYAINVHKDEATNRDNAKHRATSSRIEMDIITNQLIPKLSIPIVTVAQPTEGQNYTLNQNVNSHTTLTLKQVHDRLIWLNPKFDFRELFENIYVSTTNNNGNNSINTNYSSRVDNYNNSNNNGNSHQSNSLNNTVNNEITPYQIFCSNSVAPLFLRLSARTSFELAIREVIQLLETNTWTKFQGSKQAARANTLITWASKFEELSDLEQESVMKRLDRNYSKKHC